MNKLLWLFSILAFSIYLCGPIMDPDLFWHIVSGRWILANKTLPDSDHWTMFAYGQPWRAYSWLIEVVFAAIDRVDSYRGLYLFKLLLTCLLTFSAAYVCSRLAKDWFFGLLLGIFASAACFNHLTLRPQLCVWIIFLWLALAVERAMTRPTQRRAQLTIFLLMALWANLHITTILGLALVFLWSYRPGQLRQSVYLSAIAFAGTLFTPYLGGEWITFISKTTHPFQHSSISEFQPASIVQYSAAFPLILLVVLFIFFHERPRALEPGKFLLCAVMMLGGFAVVKFLPFAVFCATFAIADFWGREESDRRVLGNLVEGIEKLRGLLLRIPREGLAFVLICWGIVTFYSKVRDPLDDEIVPIHEFDFILEKNLPLPLMVGFGNGGYAMYRFSDKNGELPSPLHRVSIDGRTNVTPPEIQEMFMKSFFGKEGWKEYLDKVKPGTILWKNESPLLRILENGNEWCAIFSRGSERDGFAVLVKRDFIVSSGRETGLTCINSEPA